MKKLDVKPECDMIITVTHADTCSCLVEDTWCVLCGGEEDLLGSYMSNYYGLESDKFCLDCARLIHAQVIIPYEMRLLS